jgi:peptidoglycan/LPS O-acetylase OafA/YrhL
MIHCIKTKRRYDLDWLRVIGTSVVFLFHSFAIFGSRRWIVTNSENSNILYFLMTFFLLWMMPLFFLISGRVMFYSLKIKHIKEYLKSRFLRLMIPYIFSIFTFSAGIVYIQRISEGSYTGSFVKYYFSEYFNGLFGFGGNFAWQGIHLWYLLYLFIFTLLLANFVKFLTINRKELFFNNIIKLLEKPGAIFLICIPIILSSIIANMEPLFLGRTDTGGWSILSYVVFMFYGILFSYDKRFDRIILDNWKISAILSVIFVTIYFSIIADVQYLKEFNPIIKSIIFGLGSISILITLSGLFNLKMQKESIIIKKITEGVLPIYILHMPIVVLIGYFTIQLNFNLYIKLMLLIAISFSFIFSIYFFLLKRINAFRFLFGLKLIKKN